MSRVKESDILAIMNGQGCAITNFSFHKVNEVFPHDREWDRKITSLSKELSRFIEEKRIKEGVFVFRDSPPGDYDSPGFGIFENGKLGYYMLGIRAETGPGGQMGWSLMSEEISSLSLKTTKAVCDAPLIWDVVAKTNGVAVALRK
jgi:hypothetical protein